MNAYPDSLVQDGKRKFAEKRLTNGVTTPQRRNSNSNDDQQQKINKDFKSDRDSIDRILKNYPAPVLSDSDDESATENHRKRKSVTPMIVGHAVR